jgi:DHA1 family tetracycline resistance protein-like MFS transporter
MSSSSSPRYLSTFLEQLSTTTGRICLVLFLDVLAFSVVIPVLPSLILSITNGDAGQAAFLQGCASALDGIIKFLFQPLLGRLSDSVGRKPILAYSLVGSAVSFGLYVIHPSVETLFISHALHGLTQCTFLICSSAIADDQHDPENSENLTHSFGLVGVALGVAFVLGPVVGGALTNVVGFKVVYAISTLLFCLTLATLIMFMNETLPVSRRREFHCSEAIPFRTSYRLFDTYRGLFMLCVAYFLCSLTIGVYGVWILYVRVRYGWGPAGAGLMMSCNGIVVILAQGFVLRILVPKYTSEATLAVVSYTFHGILFICIANSSSGLEMLLAIAIFGVPSALGEPSIKSILAHMVPPEQGGTLQGLLGSVYTSAQVISPLVYSTIFRWSISDSMKQSFPMTCPPPVEDESVIINNSESIPPDHTIFCGGLPGLPFLIQGIVFILAAALMKRGLRNGNGDINFDRQQESVEQELTSSSSSFKMLRSISATTTTTSNKINNHNHQQPLTELSSLVVVNTNTNNNNSNHPINTTTTSTPIANKAGTSNNGESDLLLA